MRKVLVATLTYDAKTPLPFVTSLIEEQKIFHEFGEQIDFVAVPSCSVVAQGRNAICKLFLQHDYDRLVFIDADISWEPGALFKLTRYNAPVVAGAYRLKRPEVIYPVEFLNGTNTHSDVPLSKDGLLEVNWAPTGFMSISREGLIAFKNNHPDREYAHHGEDGFFCFFQMKFEGGEMHSDDVYFCKEWRAAGGQVYICPNLKITHWDFNTPYPGNLSDWLKANERQAS